MIEVALSLFLIVVDYNEVEFHAYKYKFWMPYIVDCRIEVTLSLLHIMCRSYEIERPERLINDTIILTVEGEIFNEGIQSNNDSIGFFFDGWYTHCNVL